MKRKKINRKIRTRGTRNPKSKGSRYERSVCKRLSMWVTNMKRDDVFWRSSNSGGRATVARQRGRSAAAAAGDICAIDPAGAPFLSLFYVESKHYEHLELGKWVFGQAGKRDKFWDKPCKEAREEQRTPFIVLKQNHRPELLATNEQGYHILQALVADSDLIPVSFFPRMAVGGAWVFLFQDFLTECSHDRLLEWLDE